MKKNTLFITAALSISILGIVSYQVLANEEQISSNNQIKTQEVHADFAMDVTNKAEVVGNSENVFLAKVIKQVGTTSPSPDIPRTQFEVEVLKNIKGNLKGTEIINQTVGYRKDSDGNEVLVKFENQEPLEPGKTYLFGTIYSQENNWHNPVPGYGEIKVQDQEEEKKLISEYKEALKVQKTSDIMKRHKDKDFVNGHIEE